MRKEVIEHKDSLRAAVGLLGHCKMISALLKIISYYKIAPLTCGMVISKKLYIGQQHEQSEHGNGIFLIVFIWLMSELK